MTIKPDPTAKTKISTSMKAALITIPVVLLIALIVILISALNRPTPQAATEGTGAETATLQTVQENSYVLDDAGEGAPVLVEFLDFECEACGAVYPAVEDIRKQYEGELTYVVRYFITNHANSMNAALAVEAAARQDKFEEMYAKMFETQGEWAEQQNSQADKFRAYAEQLGLDMTAYDEAITDPATQARVQEDHDAGIALGVRGTPTFFLDGKQLQPQTTTDITDAIDSAIAGKN